MQTQEHEQVGLSLVEVFRRFFSLLGLGSSQLKGEEEGLYDLLGLARKKFENSDKSEREVFRWLFRRWQKYFPDEATWREGYIVLRALFVEEMKWDEISYLTGRHVSELRMAALKSLVTQADFVRLEDRPTRDCARNDIYLLDFLSRQNWADPLTLNSDKGLKAHLKVCSRCSEMVQKSRAWVDEICEESKKDLNFLILEDLVDGREAVGSTSELLVRSLLGGAAMVAIILLVPYVPSFTKFIGAGIQQVADRVQSSKIDILDIEKVLDEVTEKEDRNLGVADEDIDAEFAGSGENDKSQLTAPAAPESGAIEKTDGQKETVAEFSAEDREEFSFNYVLLPETMIADSTEEKPLEKETKAEAASAAVAAQKSEVKSSKIASQSEPVKELQKKKSSESQKSSESLEDSNVATTKVFFRWGARAQDPERLKLKVLEILEVFKAQNISEFELGSLYKGGQYFHFTMSKSDYSKLLNGIRELPFTEFTVSEASGSRKIDASKSRIVFWVGPSK